MKFSYSTTNSIFFRFLIILPNLLIFDRQNIDKIRTQKSLLGIRLWGITFLQIERARCLPQINAIKFLGNPTGKIFQRQMKVALEVKFTPLLSRYSKVLKGLVHDNAHARHLSLQNKFVRSTLNSKSPLPVQSLKILHFIRTSVALGGLVLLW